MTPSRAELLDHLVRSRIAGDVATSRQSNLGNARRCAERDPGYTFGLRFDGEWSYEDVATLMVKRVGIDDDLSRTYGPDRIDPELTVDALDRMRDELARAATGRLRVLLGSGHPTGTMAIHLPVAAALRTAGCTLLTPAAGWSYWSSSSGGSRHLRHLAGVACTADGASLTHTHDPEPMQAMLAALDDAGEPPPDLVVADHGYTGAAGQAGVRAVGFADCNDPALFVGEAEGSVAVAVPLDDNVLPHLYDPVTRYLLEGWAC